MYKVTNTDGLVYKEFTPLRLSEINNPKQLKASPLRNYFELCLTFNGILFSINLRNHVRHRNVYQVIPAAYNLMN